MGIDYYFIIPPQLTLPPAAPVGCVTKSSTPWWTIIAFPSISFVGSPHPMHHSSVENVMVPLPSALALKFPMSPLW